MTLTSEEMLRLERDSEAFAPGHVRHLEQARSLVRTTQSALELLEVLLRLWDQSNQNDKVRINHVGRWVERRLREDSEIDASRLDLELGWLKRISKTRPAMNEPALARGDDPPLEFGQYLASLRASRRREEAKRKLAEQQRKEVVTRPHPLPSRFRARFKEIKQLQKVGAIVRKRIKSGKTVKETLLELVPLSDGLREAHGGLVCSTTRTEGFLEVYRAGVERASGGQIFFLATDVGPPDEEGKRLVARLELEENE